MQKMIRDSGKNFRGGGKGKGSKEREMWVGVNGGQDHLIWCRVDRNQSVGPAVVATLTRPFGYTKWGDTGEAWS